jgi:hypothetical protein
VKIREAVARGWAPCSRQAPPESRTRSPEVNIAAGLIRPLYNHSAISSRSTCVPSPRCDQGGAAQVFATRLDQAPAMRRSQHAASARHTLFALA